VCVCVCVLVACPALAAAVARRGEGWMERVVWKREML